MKGPYLGRKFYQQIFAILLTARCIASRLSYFRTRSATLWRWRGWWRWAAPSWDSWAICSGAAGSKSRHLKTQVIDFGGQVKNRP